jgi:sugar phosphate isomerase/epimerase
MVKIGSPLFILRDECQNDLMAVIEKLAEIGYQGIEFLGLFGRKPAEIKKKLDSCGIAAIGDHVPFDEFAGNTDRVLAEHKELGCGYITIMAPAAEGLPGGPGYKAALECMERIGEAANNAGMALLFHNHAGELKITGNGKSILENIMDDVKPGLLYLEPDLGWIQIGGGEPLYYLNKYENRCPVIHFKDFMPSENEGFQFRPTGYGAVGNAGLYNKTRTFSKPPEWYVMDHDCAYESDIYFDMKMSLEYFKNLTLVSL